MAVKLWAGRVFTRGGQGGNHTGVVFDECPEPAALAARLGFPDTAFVQSHVGQFVSVRTFSPYEELAQCIQTTLATPVALGATGGQTWRVQHPAGTLNVHVEHTDGEWICWALDSDTGKPEIVNDLPPWLSSTVVHRVPQGRSRLYAQVPSVEKLPAFDAADIWAVCRAHGCTAVVFFEEVQNSSLRTRVFTTSLGGKEDIATGGAAAGIGALLAGEHRTGRIEIIQGPAEPSAQGQLLLWLDRERRIGGRIQALLTGRTASC